jgi:hypothetical protein
LAFDSTSDHEERFPVLYAVCNGRGAASETPFRLDIRPRLHRI